MRVSNGMAFIMGSTIPLHTSKTPYYEEHMLAITFPSGDESLVVVSLHRQRSFQLPLWLSGRVDSGCQTISVFLLFLTPRKLTQFYAAFRASWTRREKDDRKRKEHKWERERLIEVQAMGRPAVLLSLASSQEGHCNIKQVDIKINEGI